MAVAKTDFIYMMAPTFTAVQPTDYCIAPEKTQLCWSSKV